MQLGYMGPSNSIKYQFTW
uniref:Uncharacterized protein n=1 Tax=Arundo donax TaxID=35708 RepID=A0A0A8YML3_ARUDO